MSSTLKASLQKSRKFLFLRKKEGKGEVYLIVFEVRKRSCLHIGRGNYPLRRGDREKGVFSKNRRGAPLLDSLLRGVPAGNQEKE